MSPPPMPFRSLAPPTQAHEKCTLTRRPVPLAAPAVWPPQDPLVLAKYGFLYSSYSPRLPYWETTEMLRKFAIAFIPVRGGGVGCARGVCVRARVCARGGRAIPRLAALVCLCVAGWGPGWGGVGFCIPLPAAWCKITHAAASELDLAAYVCAPYIMLTLACPTPSRPPPRPTLANPPTHPPLPPPQPTPPHPSPPHPHPTTLRCCPSGKGPPLC